MEPRAPCVFPHMDGAENLSRIIVPAISALVLVLEPDLEPVLVSDLVSVSVSAALVRWFVRSC